MEKMFEEIISGVYKSPIEIIVGQAISEFEDGVYKAVQDYGVNVDKEELIRALQYDRGQFEAGYKARDDKIVRCKDCKWYREGEIFAPNKFCFRLRHPAEDRRIGYNFAPDDFCSYGKRKGGAE
jgi:hypothetical protein